MAEETVFSPERDGGGQRVPQERPAVAPKPDRSGRSADGPQTAKFDPDDVSDADMEAGEATVRAARGKAQPRPERGTKDATLRRFLDS